MINNAAEDLAKYSAKKFAALGGQFDHHPVMPQLRASPAGEGRNASGCC
jgi:hypothetical protein